MAGLGGVVQKGAPAGRIRGRLAERASQRRDPHAAVDAHARNREAILAPAEKARVDGHRRGVAGRLDGRPNGRVVAPGWVTEAADRAAEDALECGPAVDDLATQRLL